MTNYHKEARDVILYFAQVSRHGLIPNLHDMGHNTRFNARDATWFFLQSIKDYIQASDEGVKFLNQSFKRVSLSDHHIEHLEAVKQGKPERETTIADLIQEIFQKHAEGIDFREWNAGSKIDEHMKDEGFDIKVKLDPTTGLIVGGNSHNCGTWMDKMGSAPSNKGIPGSPRDGAPIEITGLCYSVVSWLAELHTTSVFKYDGVDITDEHHYTYEAWAENLKHSFERCYYIPNDSSEDFEYGCNSDLVNERGIYRDLAKSSEEWRNYQCRPNQVVAMAVAPDLFTPKLARIALDNLKILISNDSLGMKTLSTSDSQYKGHYDNSDETSGWNYHNGPEWVWPLGYFLTARLIFFDEKSHKIMQFLIPHQKYYQKCAWMSLPELTNENGSYCSHSCEAQAWSVATILEAMNN